MTNIDLENYIKVLTQREFLTNETLEQVSKAKSLLRAYQIGLEGKEFDLDLMNTEVFLTEIPDMFHTLVGQMAVLNELVYKNVEDLLNRFRDYFLPYRS